MLVGQIALPWGQHMEGDRLFPPSTMRNAAHSPGSIIPEVSSWRTIFRSQVASPCLKAQFHVTGQ